MENIDPAALQYSCSAADSIITHSYAITHRIELKSCIITLHVGRIKTCPIYSTEIEISFDYIEIIFKNLKIVLYSFKIQHLQRPLDLVKLDCLLAFCL